MEKIKDFSNYDKFITDEGYTTSAQAQEFFRNQNVCLKDVVASYWQPETSYVLGDVIYSAKLGKSLQAVCVSAGKSSTLEPTWGTVGGANVSDGTCFWKLRFKQWSEDVATQQEAEAGVADDKAMTPKKTKQLFDKFLPKLDKMEGVLPIEKGGTESTNAKDALIALGICNTEGHLVLPNGAEIWVE